MFTGIMEELEHRRHISLMQKHIKDAQFPLDGSEWARLVQLRLDHEHHACDCHRCTNLLTRLHSKDSPFKGDRVAVQRALHHWFFHNVHDQWSSPWPMGETSGVHALKTLTTLGSSVQGLAAVEKQWLMERNKAWKLHETAYGEAGRVSGAELLTIPLLNVRRLGRLQLKKNMSFARRIDQVVPGSLEALVREHLKLEKKAEQAEREAVSARTAAAKAVAAIPKPIVESELGEWKE
jgi:hypothetical protein